MNHHENQEELHEHHHAHNEQGGCCGGMCGDDDMCDRNMKIAMIAQRVLLGGAFLFSLLTLVFLPRIVKRELAEDQALKAGGMDNYKRLNDQIYNTQDYKDYMKTQVDAFIEQNKATMEMYKQQQAGSNQTMMPETGEEETATGTGAMMMSGDAK